MKYLLSIAAFALFAGCGAPEQADRSVGYPSQDATTAAQAQSTGGYCDAELHKDKDGQSVIKHVCYDKNGLQLQE